jgi:hypothetical protein
MEFISPDLLDSRDHETIHIIHRFEYAPISINKVTMIIKEAEIALSINTGCLQNSPKTTIPIHSELNEINSSCLKYLKPSNKVYDNLHFTIKNKPLLRKKLMKGNLEIIIFRQTGDWEIITYDLLDSYDNEFIHLIYPYSYRFISIEKVDIVISEIERDIYNKINLQTSELLEERTLFRLLEGGVVRKN